MEETKNVVGEPDYKEMYFELSEMYRSAITRLRGIETTFNLLPIFMGVIEHSDKFKECGAEDIIEKSIGLIRSIIMPIGENADKKDSE